ncbi:MAG: hypothetical protein UT95_C0047G0001, partial [Candidatus Curtissbacteria bacterium GW2011_GWB1_40_28]
AKMTASITRMEITIKSSMRVTPFLINLIVALPPKMVKSASYGDKTNFYLQVFTLQLVGDLYFREVKFEIIL